MPGLLFHAQATVTCAHGGRLTITPTQFRALVRGRPIATSSDAIVVAGCAGVSGAFCSTVQVGQRVRPGAGGPAGRCCCRHPSLRCHRPSATAPWWGRHPTSRWS